MKSPLQSRNFCRGVWSGTLYYWRRFSSLRANTCALRTETSLKNEFFFRNPLPDQVPEIWAQGHVYEHWAGLRADKVASVDTGYTSFLYHGISFSSMNKLDSNAFVCGIIRH